MTPEYISTNIADLSLELLREDDAQELFNLVDGSRDHLRVWLPWVDSSKSVQDSLEFIKRGLKEYKDWEGVHYAIKFGDTITGIMGCNNIEADNQFAEIGYWIGKDWEGRGFISETCRVLADELFKSGIKTVQICTNPKNHRSRAIPRRHQFTHIETKVVKGELLEIWQKSI